MAKGKSDRGIVTHDELITLFRKWKLAERDTPELANAAQNRLECKFRIAIDEARIMGVLTVELLGDLRNLVDPESEGLICPPTLKNHLNNTIAHYMAIERKKGVHVPQRATEAEA